jgi:AAA15 family ATPase/GTPase
MNLVSFTVRNYRSITKAYKLPLGNFSVLVGPNNEGKSNILRAIVTSLYILSDYSDDLTRRRFNRSIRIRRSRTLRERFAYDWETDFP